MNNLKKKRTIVYLYSEIMPYVISIMSSIVAHFDVEIHCISWDKNKKTPYMPSDLEGVRFYKRSEFDQNTIRKFIDDLAPEIIVASGRMDKLYLDTVKHYKQKGIKTVSLSDNQWFGTLKHHITALFSKYLYHQYYSHIWVAGWRQYLFAKRIGYKNENVIPHFLAPDITLFEDNYKKCLPEKQRRYPHSIVFVGRFAATKGLDLLLRAFTEAREELKNDWELVLIGSGDMQLNPDNQPFIKVKAFMSTTELAATTGEWGVFCLPSIYDPWGVVVHEFAAAGMPIICSTSVGAGDQFVINNYNGYTFESGNADALKSALKKVMTKSDDELLVMGGRSCGMAATITPDRSAYSLMSILND